MAPADVGLGGLLGGGLRLALLQLHLVKLRAQHVPGLRAIAVLRAVVLAKHHDVGRDVGEADRRLGLVDVLAPCPAGAHGIGAHVRLLDVDLDAVVDHRIDVDAGERGVAARVGIERRDAHQPVHAVLALEPAIGVAALDLHGRRLDAGLFAAGLLDPLDLVAVLLGPARVHAHEHVGPVLALGAAGAGMDLEVGVVAVGLARQQRLELAPGDVRLEPPQRVLGVGDDGAVLLGLAELDHGELVVELLLDAPDGGELVLERGALLHQALRALLVVPESGVLGLLVQLLKPRPRLVEVKDASSAARPTA